MLGQGKGEKKKGGGGREGEAMSLSLLVSRVLSYTAFSFLNMREVEKGEGGKKGRGGGMTVIILAFPSYFRTNTEGLYLAGLLKARFLGLCHKKKEGKEKKERKRKKREGGRRAY